MIIYILLSGDTHCYCHFYLHVAMVTVVRSDMWLHHNGDLELVESDPVYRTSYQRCTPHVLSLVLGRKNCVTLMYQNTSLSQTHAYFPLNGPFRLDVEAAGDDP
jgi:hypothetical protein